MKEELQSTCHFDKINDVCFPARFSKVFLTCSKSDIRVWDRKKKTELLRIQLKGVECRTICVTDDGKSIVSGWSDGKIRLFAPESGKLKSDINDAHEDVTALAVTSDNKMIVSGGSKGKVRMWGMRSGKM